MADASGWVTLMEGYGGHVQAGFPLWAIPARATAATGSSHMITSTPPRRGQQEIKAGVVEGSARREKKNANKLGEEAKPR